MRKELTVELRKTGLFGEHEHYWLESDYKDGTFVGHYSGPVKIKREEDIRVFVPEWDDYIRFNQLINPVFSPIYNPNRQEAVELTTDELLKSMADLVSDMKIRAELVNLSYSREKVLEVSADIETAHADGDAPTWEVEWTVSWSQKVYGFESNRDLSVALQMAYNKMRNMRSEINRIES